MVVKIDVTYYLTRVTSAPRPEPVTVNMKADQNASVVFICSVDRPMTQLPGRRCSARRGTYASTPDGDGMPRALLVDA